MADSIHRPAHARACRALNGSAVRLFLLALVLVVLVAALAQLAGRNESRLAMERPSASREEVGALDSAPRLAAERGLLTVDGRALGSAVQTSGGATYRLPVDFVLSNQGGDAAVFHGDGILGPSKRVSANYRSTDDAIEVTLEVELSDRLPAAIYQVRTLSLDEDAALDRFFLLDGASGSPALQAPVEYLALLGTGQVQGTVTAGSGPVTVPLPKSAPLLLWSEGAGYGYVLALLDETRGRTALRLAPAQDEELRVQLATSAQSASLADSPRLFIERTESRDLTRAFAGYRALLDVIAPAPPIPWTFRQQWDSWYVYGGDVDEFVLRQQVDAIADRYGDLGPWQLVIDAGWYLAGSDPDGAIGTLDPPSSLPA